MGLKEQGVYGGWLEMKDEEMDEDEDMEVSGLEVTELGEVSVKVKKVGAKVVMESESLESSESGEEESDNDMEV